MVATEGMDDWEWKKVPGANWRQPFGTDLAQKIPMKDDYPVVSVSWVDAVAYCEHQGKHLPTEAEWEYAARAGKSDSRFPWGNLPKRDDGRIGLNYWEGLSHRKNQTKGGYIYMSPVKAVPPNAWGLYDPIGNVWQWTADWYDSETYKRDISGAGMPVATSC